ncbi:MAG: hypothetical protein R3C14_13125 [Caldilineaceae bacterium]
MKIELLASHDPAWRTTVDELYPLLGGGQNPTLLPYHFLQVVLPHIGGALLRVWQGDQFMGVGFALPAVAPASAPVRAYVVRYHTVISAPASQWELIQQECTKALSTPHVALYDPTLAHPYTATRRTVGTLEIGRPDGDEAMMIRRLQQQIWGSPPEFLYPTDLHSTDFPLGTSLVARVDGQLAGFLFGFYKWADEHEDGLAASPRQMLRIESQVMGVLPAYRGLRIGFLLKKLQAEAALAQCIGVINWTFDPLQYPNAALNFGLLRAVALHFIPDYYPFRNELNRGPASRFSLTWPIGAPRVRAVPLYDAQSTVINLAQQPAIVRVNQGWAQVDLAATAPRIAVEIPARWTELQQNAPEEARQWRTATDQIFAHYVGAAPGKYAVTDVGVEGERRFLVATRMSDQFWQALYD